MVNIREARDETIRMSLMYGERYQTIILRLGVSSKTINRVAREMREGRQA